MYQTPDGQLIPGIPELDDELPPISSEDLLEQHEHEEIIELCESEELFNIITLADVNRRSVREALYPVIAELESRLAEEIRESGNTAVDMFSDLSPETIGRWQKSKVEDITMDISEYMTLSEMVKIIGKSESLRSEFGYDSRSQFDDDIGGLIGLRNRIMHPTRTLVHNREDLNKLLERISRAEEIIESHGGIVNRGNYSDRHFTY